MILWIGYLYYYCRYYRCCCYCWHYCLCAVVHSYEGYDLVYMCLQLGRFHVSFPSSMSQSLKKFKNPIPTIWDIFRNLGDCHWQILPDNFLRKVLCLEAHNWQVDIRLPHILADREVPYLKLGSHQRLQKEDVCTIPPGLWSALLKTQDEVIVQLLHQGGLPGVLITINQRRWR